MSRLLAVVLGVVVVLGGILALTAAFTARDDADVTRSEGPGTQEPDRGAAHGAGAPMRQDGDPPTSGPHRPDLISRDRRPIDDDRLLHALELGNVVILYPDAEPPAALTALQEEAAGPFDAELAAAGQTVVLARAQGIDGYQALAWRHRQTASEASDPALREFADYWLGRGLDARR